MSGHRRIVITGTSSGIGRALAGRLTAQGCAVWGLARRAPEDFPHPAASAGGGGSFRYSVCDVSDWAAVRAAAGEIGAAWSGAADALICCAGAQGAVGPAMTLDPAAWSRTVRVNLDGTFYSVAAFFPLLQRAARRAKALCFSGGGAASPRPNFSAYGAAKAGVVRLVETLAQEWRELPMDINAIAPGALPTAMTQETLALGPKMVGEAEYQTARKTAANGGGEAAFAKVSGLVDFLLSPASDGITGRLLSAPHDDWSALGKRREELAGSDVFTLRRIVPEDRGKSWN